MELRSLSGIAIALLFASALTNAQGERQERIVFASTRAGNTDIYTANLDGTALRRLTTDPLEDEIPRCSPDGRHAVFLRGGFSERGELYRVDLATGEEQRLTSNDVRDSTPQWSADGRQIFFTRRVNRHDRIAVMNADGTGVKYLTGEEGWHDTMPGVSPDGRTLVHHTYRYGRETELHLLDVETGATRRLTTHSGLDYEASFAGRDLVVFSSNRDGGHYRLYVLSTADGAVRLLADTGADIWAGRYSPRSNAVLFHTGRDGQWRLMRVPLEGGTPTAVMADGFSNASGDWCP